MWLVAWCFERPHPLRHKESAAETVDSIKSTLYDMGPRVKLLTLNQYCQKELLKAHSEEATKMVIQALKWYWNQLAFSLLRLLCSGPLIANFRGFEMRNSALHENFRI